MKVALFSGFNTKLNPYILLFKRALESQNISVSLKREFNLKWLLFEGRQFDCLHMHWVNILSAPSPVVGDGAGFRKIFNNRVVKSARKIVRILMYLFSLLVARWQGKKVVFTIHDLDRYVKYSRRSRLINHFAFFFVFLLCSRIHVHNHYTRKLIYSRYRIRRNVVVIPHGSYVGFYPNKVSRQEARLRLDLPEKAFVYLFLGMIRPYKGLEGLFDAFRRIDRPEDRLVVAGKPVGDAAFEGRLSEFDKRDPRVSLVPQFVPDEDIQVYMNACDVCVLPYRHITTSGAAALVFSFGRPVVAPAITSFSEIITPETGILYDVSDPEGLLSALESARARSWSASKILAYAHSIDWLTLSPQLAALYDKKEI